jgi:hypothetical protein
MSNYEYGLADTIVIDSLKESARSNFDADQNEDDILNHILGMLEYYMVYNDYQDFLKELYPQELTEEEASNFRVVEEFKDGSALIEFEVTEEEKKTLIGMGCNFGLIKLILGTASDDEILSWAQLGKEMTDNG